MTLLERCISLHLADLRSGSTGTVSHAFRAALEECIALGRRDLWRKARQEAGEQYSRERITFEDERHGG